MTSWQLMERNLMMEEMDNDSEEFIPPAHLSDKIEKIMRAIGKQVLRPDVC